MALASPESAQEQCARALHHAQDAPIVVTTTTTTASAAVADSPDHARRGGSAVRVHVHTPTATDAKAEDGQMAAERHKRRETNDAAAATSGGGGGSTLSIKLSITLASVYLFTSMFFFLSIRYSQAKSEVGLNSACLVLMVEFTKIILTVVLLFRENGENLLKIMFITGDVSTSGGGKGGGSSSGSSSSRSANRKALWKRGLPLAVPALIYAVYNNLTFFNLNRFHAGTYQVFMQSRILFTGLLFTTVLRQSLTLRKWFALVLLTCGLALKYLSPHLKIDGYIVVMLGQALLSALAGVYNEYYLKEDMHLSIHVQNFFMYFYGIIFNCLLGFLLDPSFFFKLHFAEMLTWKVVPIVFFGASTGIAAAFILKFINVIVKAIASAVEVSLTAVFARVLLGEPFSPRDVPSALVVTAAIAVYYTKGLGDGRSWSVRGGGKT